MAEWGNLIAFQTTNHSFFSPSNMIPRHAHKRSLSSEHRSLSPDRTVIKAKSTTNLAEVAAPTAKFTSSSFDESCFSTLQDPRLMVAPEVSDSTSSSPHHPDLSNEVAALSVKLIQAINNQTNLDDSLVATRQELELAQGKIKALEFQNEKYRREIENQTYIKKFDSDRVILQLREALAEECSQRAAVEKGKKTIEQELESLTAALFEEANRMVAAAKIEREAVEKKNEQLRAQVKDTELLLASHQDQLAELKSVMQGMNLNKNDVESRLNTAPPSPARPQEHDSAKEELELESVPVSISEPEELSPGPSSSFPQLIRMICRTDLQAYEDFRDLLILSRSSKPPSRVASGSYGGLNVMSFAGFATGGTSSATSSPTKVFSHSPNGSTSSITGSHIPLKETRFYKRVLIEDIEPTLRLDLAPGISWLTRRTVLNGICEGSLVVEPMPSASKEFEFPCSVCGERRPGTINERTHRFRTSDNENAQRYSLCLLCVERVRSCCEFTGYLRLILDGHLRAGDAEEEKEIWDETIRLRERMFWSRIGGGIVPLFNRSSAPEALPEVPDSNARAADGNDDLYLHPVDVTHIDSRVEKTSLTVDHTTETSTMEAYADHYTHADAPRPQSSIYDREDVESLPDSARKRFSVESAVSVYEEASADVVVEAMQTVSNEPSAHNPEHDTEHTSTPIALSVDTTETVPREPSDVQNPDKDTERTKHIGLSDS
ncbi:uncharacterized protein N7515_008554 [Penicillium bovifimosum]|uniref:GDP/GTP exchange factor Sec2 N-terminal domain-containing protein n=1 Tax=Penicillium bovifimosum TaxID=126998 RepID=A0A9W9GNI8_9EURO|nr:uncharacterized protein N7515_008554 [Penicillium bovifimosum]KAJ5124729.1 hypothetical protein N7515_008554 [Penicillium bovifimosum]